MKKGPFNNLLEPLIFGSLRFFLGSEASQNGNLETQIISNCSNKYFSYFKALHQQEVEKLTNRGRCTLLLQVLVGG